MLEAAVICLALNIYHEARGEPIEGRRMVAYVTMNRANWNQRLVCPTVFADRQFSWTNQNVTFSKKGYTLHMTAKPRDKKAWTSAMREARRILQVGKMPAHLDPSHGATHYHADYVWPKWSRQFECVKVVGRHYFYRVA
jgi:spore germination cell wall hydrolase CwlJ-like protein